MTENLQDELYPLEKKQAKKVLNFVLTLKWKLEGKKCSKTFFKVLERQNLNHTISELYVMIIN